MFLKLAQTLQGIHQRSVTHNSVCPANVCIYVGKDGYGCSLRGWHTARHCDRSDDEFEKGVMRDLFGLATVMSSLAPWDAGIMALSEDVLHGRCTTDNDLIKRMKEMRRVWEWLENWTRRKKPWPIIYFPKSAFVSTTVLWVVFIVTRLSDKIDLNISKKTRRNVTILFSATTILSAVFQPIK